MSVIVTMVATGQTPVANTSLQKERTLENKVSVNHIRSGLIPFGFFSPLYNSTYTYGTEVIGLLLVLEDLGHPMIQDIILAML